MDTIQHLSRAPGLTSQNRFGHRAGSDSMALSGVGGVAAAFHARLENRLPPSPVAPRAADFSSDGSERADDEEIAIMSSSIKLSVEQEQSITLDDEDFESIDLLVRNVRKPSRPQQHHVHPAARRRVLSTAGVLAICFFCVCGGPVGPDTVIADDPVTGTLFLVLFPLLCSGPFAAIVAELCSALPEDGGYVVWALNAFGPATAFQVGYWAWVASIFARVYRIALAYSLIESALHISLAWGASFAIKAAITIALTLPSLLGTKPLTLTLAVVLVAFVVAPYTVLTGWGYSQESITADATVKTSSGEPIDWVGLGNTLFWSFDGFHMTSTVGGHVLNPARTFPHAIYFTFLAVYTLYLLPMLASYSAVREYWRQLNDWSFPALADRIGGPGLRGLIIIATVAGLLGMYMAQVFCEGYQLSGMADVALVPKILKRRSRRFDSPYISISVSLAAVLAVTTCDMDVLLPVANTFAALTQFVILAAAIELRRSLPYMPRPAKVPGGMPLMILLSVLPTLLLGYLVVHTFMKPTPAVVCGALLVLGALLDVVRVVYRRRTRRFL